MEKLKNEIKNKEELIKKNDLEVTKFKTAIKNQVRIRKELLEKKEEEINQLKKGKNDLSNLKKKPNEKDSEVNVLILIKKKSKIILTIALYIMLKKIVLIKMDLLKY